MLVRLSRCIAYCLEHACACREKAHASTSLSGRDDFSDLEDRWLRLAASYSFSERLAARMNDQGAHKRNIRTILNRAGAVRYVRDDDAIACMTLAYNEVMTAVSSTGAEMPESMTVARLIVESATRGERDPDRLCNSVLSLLNAKDQTANREAILIRSSGDPNAKALRHQDHRDPDTVSIAWLEYGLSRRWMTLVLGLAVFLVVTILMGIVWEPNDRRHVQIDHRLNPGVAQHNVDGSDIDRSKGNLGGT
jgi:hypothetical protein